MRPDGPVMFLQPDEDTTPNPSSSPSASTSTSGPIPETAELAPETSPSELPQWSSSPDVSDVDDLEHGLAGPTSSRASSGKASFSRAATREATRKAVKMTGVGVHQVLARDDIDRELGTWLTDDEDDKAIGDPLGSIVHRHGWLGKAGNPDVVDGINALIGLASYVWKQMVRLNVARLERQARQAGQSAAAAEGGDVDEGSPW